MQNWQHCKLVGNKVCFLSAANVFDNKSDAHITERVAWSKLEDDGWELVSVIMNEDGEREFFLKRPKPSED